MPPTRPIPPPPSSPKELLARIVARWVGIWWYFCTWWTGSIVAKIRHIFVPNPGLWVSQRKVRRGGRTKRKNTHTQPTQKQEEKLFKCLKTFAKPANFAHAHICTASRAPFHTESVGWQCLQSKSCPDIVVRRGDTHELMRFLFNLWFKSELRSFWCTLYMDLWCRPIRWNFWFFNVESAPVHKFGPHL